MVSSINIIMGDIDRLRVEKADMSDRELLLEMLDYQRTQNGAIAKIMSDYYGSDEYAIKGTKTQVTENTRDIDRGKTVGKTLVAVVSIIGIGNIIALVNLVAR